MLNDQEPSKRTSAAAIWTTVHTERRRLVADLSALRDERWNVSSLCPGWDVHDVLAHLVDTVRTGRLAFVRELLRARMDFDRANDNGIAREKRPNPHDTLEAFVQAAVSGRRVDPERLAGSAASRFADATGRPDRSRGRHQP